MVAVPNAILPCMSTPVSNIVQRPDPPTWYDLPSLVLTNDLHAEQLALNDRQRVGGHLDDELRRHDDRQAAGPHALVDDAWTVGHHSLPAEDVVFPLALDTWTLGRLQLPYST